jgi:arginine-tRNA-protein transferase
MYFDPEFARRSLGTYSLLWECKHALDCGLQYYYLGYYVADCPKMSYKAAFRPAEMRIETGEWVPSDL